MKHTYAYSLAALIGSAFLFAITGCDSGNSSSTTPAEDSLEGHGHEAESSHDAAMPDHHDHTGAH